MPSDELTEFRHAVSRRARQAPAQWEASKRLVEGSTLPSTMAQLSDAIQRRDLPEVVRQVLLSLFDQPLSSRLQDLNSETLKSLTGLPPAKAVRALCVWFQLVPPPASKWPTTCLSSEAVEGKLRQLTNPFEFLAHADVASVLDIGAGDLSFAEELVDLYGQRCTQENRPFILHCLDRLDPRSRLGGPLHVEPERLHKLQQREGLSLSFFGNQDMFELGALDERGSLAPRYTIATCWAPASPTFAYEPTRLSQVLIAQDLERTRGAFRQTRYGKEVALEVQHRDRALLFPSWKFDVIGPRALLKLLAQRGVVCVLGSVDVQVFWELLAQLLDDPRYRPQDQAFHPENLPMIFGKIYEALTSLPVGESIDLAKLAPLRQKRSDSAGFLHTDDRDSTFRYVRITRGAIFPGMPASSTARKFSAMTEEVPPWLVTLIPA
ncbi:MAG TPA: hypothetical protein PKD12_04995 [Nitrospira sp.]|nr:hypothetical protein [Nitrospira sp.]